MIYLNNFIQIFELINSAKQISIFTHEKPDGDAIGSSLALFLYLKKIKKNVNSFYIDEIPQSSNLLLQTKNLSFIDSFNEEFNSTSKEHIENSDLVFILDVNNQKRINKPFNYVNKQKTKIVIIDHHQMPEEFADYIYVDVDSTSTCEIIYKLIWSYSYYQKHNKLENTLSEINDKSKKLNFADSFYLDYIDYDIAISLYNGIITDTGNFKYQRTDGEILNIIANLLQYGFDIVKTHKIIFESLSFNKYKLKLLVQNQTEFIYNNSVAISFITKENFENTGTSLIDGEGFSSMPLEIEGINISVLIREDLTDFRKESDNKLKTYRVSFRSFGDINIQKMALHFGGGGHINASGSTFIAEDISIVITQIKEYIITNYKFD